MWQIIVAYIIAAALAAYGLFDVAYETRVSWAEKWPFAAFFAFMLGLALSSAVRELQ